MSRVATKGLHQIFRKSIISQSTRAASVRALTSRQFSSVSNERTTKSLITDIKITPVKKMSTVQTTFTPDFLFRQVSLSLHVFWSFKYLNTNWFGGFGNQLIVMVDLDFHYQSSNYSFLTEIPVPTLISWQILTLKKLSWSIPWLIWLKEMPKLSKTLDWNCFILVSISIN